MDAAGVSESSIMALLGWKTSVMLRRYLGESEEKLRTAGVKLTAHLAAVEQPRSQAVVPLPKSKRGPSSRAGARMGQVRFHER
jgi:hypothetical protein